MPRPRKSGPALSLKKPPVQRRAAETFERILEVAARTLTDVGIDRLSTNLVCERAGLTPPALYRYFPNKYALLVELARRLMLRQNELIPRWMTREVLFGPTGALQAALQGLVLDTYRVTRDTTAGVWITRALRAVPALAHVRLQSHDEVTRTYTQVVHEAFPALDVKEIRLASRVSVELLYAAVEMLFDEKQMDPQAAAAVAAAMVGGYLGQLLAKGGHGARPPRAARKGAPKARAPRTHSR